MQKGQEIRAIQSSVRIVAVGACRVFAEMGFCARRRELSRRIETDRGESLTGPLATFNRKSAFTIAWRACAPQRAFGFTGCSDNAQGDRFQNGARTISRSKFRENIRNIVLNRPFGEVEAPRDFFVRISAG